MELIPVVLVGKAGSKIDSFFLFFFFQEQTLTLIMVLV